MYFLITGFNNLLCDVLIIFFLSDFFFQFLSDIKIALFVSFEVKCKLKNLIIYLYINQIIMQVSDMYVKEKNKFLNAAF